MARQQIQAVRNSTANPGPSRPYPLQIPRCLYRERDPVRLRKAERFNALAERLEQHINSQVEKSNDRIQISYCGGIALDLRIDEKEVEGRATSYSVRKLRTEIKIPARRVRITRALFLANLKPGLLTVHFAPIRTATNKKRETHMSGAT